MDIDQLIRGIIEGEKEKDEKLGRSDHIKQIEEFRSIIGNDSIREGDTVERNSFGLKRYKFPHEGQLAICHKKLDTPILDSEGMPCDMQMMVSFAKGKVLIFPVQSAYYQKAEEKKNIFPLFRGKTH